MVDGEEAREILGITALFTYGEIKDLVTTAIRGFRKDGTHKQLLTRLADTAKTLKPAISLRGYAGRMVVGSERDDPDRYPPAEEFLLLAYLVHDSGRPFTEDEKLVLGDGIEALNNGTAPAKEQLERLVIAAGIRDAVLAKKLSDALGAELDQQPSGRGHA
jgi:hypothetical protein